MITYNNLSDNFKSLPIYFYTACDRHLQESIKRPNGLSDFHQILFVVAGKGILKYGDRTYELQKGSAFFTAIGVPMEYRNTGDLVTAFLTASGPAVTDLMNCFSCDGFLFYESVNVEKYVADISRIINKYYERKQEGMLSAMVYSFYTDFFEQQNNHDTLLLRLYL